MNEESVNKLKIGETQVQSEAEDAVRYSFKSTNNTRRRTDRGSESKISLFIGRGIPRVRRARRTRRLVAGGRPEAVLHPHVLATLEGVVESKAGPLVVAAVQHGRAEFRPVEDHLGHGGVAQDHAVDGVYGPVHQGRRGELVGYRVDERFEGAGVQQQLLHELVVHRDGCYGLRGGDSHLAAHLGFSGGGSLRGGQLKFRGASRMGQ